MLGIILYCIGVMYTPGPVNIISLNVGMQRGLLKQVPFCAGVSCALCFWFLLIGYTGSALVNDSVLPFVAAGGGCFIFYLAYKILSSTVDTKQSGKGLALLGFKEGLFMQLLNPKSMLAVLPVTTVQFPAVGIDGASIAIWSVGLAILGFGAPFSYTAIGATVARHIQNGPFFKYFNIAMGLMLVVVGIDMAYHHVYLALV